MAASTDGKCIIISEPENVAKQKLPIRPVDLYALTIAYLLAARQGKGKWILAKYSFGKATQLTSSIMQSN